MVLNNRTIRTDLQNYLDGIANKTWKNPVGFYDVDKVNGKEWGIVYRDQVSPSWLKKWFGSQNTIGITDKEVQDITIRVKDREQF
jgi:hypothetical protein